MNGKIHHIQALRGFAASLVVIDHALGPIVKSGVLPTYFDAVRYNIGSIGVQIFFVISGFIMVHTTHDQFGSGAFKFAVKRLIRIVPIYWIATLAAFTLSGFGRNMSTIPELLQSMAFIPYVGSNDVMQPVLGQGWTLNYEMFFYSAFTLALLAPRQTGLSALIGAFIVITAAGAYFHPAPGALMFWSQPIILMFVAGIVIGVLEKRFMHYRLPNPFLITALIISIEIGICIALQIHQDPPFPAAILFSIPAIAAVLVCALPTRDEPTIATWAAQQFGDASYSTYLFHLFVIAALNRIVNPTSVALAIVYVLIALIASNLFGLLLYSVIEQPSGLRLRGLFVRRSSSAVPLPTGL